MDSSLGKNIKKYRKISKLTQTELGKKIGKSLRMIQSYESGETIPSLDVINNISQETGVNLLNIVGEVDYKQIIDDDSLNEQGEEISVSDIDLNRIKGPYTLFKEYLIMEFPDSYNKMTEAQIEDIYNVTYKVIGKSILSVLFNSDNKEK